MRIIPIYIIWIYLENKWNFFDVYSFLLIAEATTTKMHFLGIKTRITEHKLEIEDLLETLSSDIIKNLNI